MEVIEQRTDRDCERCCYAMVLGLRYEDVPDFYAIYKQTRRDERDKWLAERGLCKLTVDLKGGSHGMPLNGPLGIAGVASPTGCEDGHAVVARIRNWVIETVYDPSPHREKSGKTPFDFTFFMHIDLSGPAAPVTPPGDTIATP